MIEEMSGPFVLRAVLTGMSGTLMRRFMTFIRAGGGELTRFTPYRKLTASRGAAAVCG
jgi:hypothetical protein